MIKKYQRYFKYWENQTKHKICFFPAEEAHKCFYLLSRILAGASFQRREVLLFAIKFYYKLLHNTSSCKNTFALNTMEVAKRISENLRKREHKS